MDIFRGKFIWILDYITYQLLFTNSLIFTSLIVVFIIFPNYFWGYFILLLLVLFYLIKIRSAKSLIFLIFFLLSLVSCNLIAQKYDDSSKLSDVCGVAKCEVGALVISSSSCFGSYCSVEITNIIVNGEEFKGNYKLISRVESSLFLVKGEWIKFSSRYDDYVNSNYLMNLPALAKGQMGVFKYPQNLTRSKELEYGYSFSSILKNYKEYTEQVGKEIFGENYEIIAGLLLGEKDYFDIHRDEIVRLGLAHAFVVSGFNLGVIIFVLSKFDYWVGRKNIIIVSILYAILFLLMLNDVNTPALRAFVMLTIISVSKIFGFNVKVLPTIAFSIFILLLINPFTIFQISFQLTFLALIGIVYFTEIFEKYISIVLPKSFSSLISASMLATLFTSPVIIYYFESLSIFGIVSTLFTLVLIELITVFGAVFYLFAWVPFVPEIMGVMLTPWLNLFLWTISFLEQFGFSYSIEKKWFWVPILFIVLLIIYRIKQEYQKDKILGKKISN